MFFLCLLIILKCTLDYFYDRSKHNESRTDCNSCHIQTILFRVAYYGIRGVLWLYSAQCLLFRQRKKTVDASPLNAKMQFGCNSLTLSERERDFNLYFSTRDRNYIQFIVSDCRSGGCEVVGLGSPFLVD